MNYNILKTIQLLQELIHEKHDAKRGCWEGRQWMNAAVTAEFLILCKYIGHREPDLTKKALREVISRQNKDGGFPAYFQGPSDLSISCICYLALEIYREKPDSSHMTLAQKYISEQGGLKKAMLLPKFYHFIFGKFSVSGLPEMRPELIVVPLWAGFSIYDMASWVRSWLVPLSVVWHHEKYKNYRYRIKPYFPFLRNMALKKAEKWLIDHQESDGSWYSVFHSTMMSMLALHNLGYTIQDSIMQRAYDFILSLQEVKGENIRQQAFLGPVWDSAYAILALNPSQPKAETKLMLKSKSFLLSKQSLIRSDWAKHNAHEPGGWGFEISNNFYPDIDTTSLVLKALNTIKSNPDEESQIKQGLAWLISMQNSNGSWSAFDRNNNHRIIEWYLNLRKYNIGQGKGLVLDRGTPDLTAHALDALSDHGFDINSDMVSKAVKWLRKTQCSDGSWFGRWGLCYIYGTGAVLEALAAIGEDMKQPYVKDAVTFLKIHQNSDGGFGELPDAYHDSNMKGKGKSTLTQTSWALTGLIGAGEVSSDSAQKAIDFITNSINANGVPIEKEYQAVAAPPMYQRYELYPYYFPLLALKKYSEAIKNE